MKRVLCGALLAAAAFTAVPAHAYQAYDVNVLVWTEPNRVGVGAEYSRDGRNYDPVGAAYVDPTTGRVCAGLSYQIPVCLPPELT
jgi:hypothetical protein